MVVSLAACAPVYCVAINRAMATPAEAQQTARQRLGDVIAFHRTQRGRTQNDVARRLKCSVSRIEQIEQGAAIPTAEEWKALREGVNRALFTYSDLRLRALAEQKTEQDTITRSIEVHTNGTTRNNPATKIGTNLGDKLPSLVAAASSSRPAPDSPTAPPSVAPAPAVAAPPKVDHAVGTSIAMQQLPPGWKSAAAVQQRREFVKDLIRKRPGIRGTGSDSINSELERVFGVGIGHTVIDQLRAEVVRETAPPTPPIALPQVQTYDAAHNVQPGDLEAAVQLVLGAVPNLRTFSITVDDSGEASIDYTVREVVVRENTGTFKVRRG